MAAVWPVLLPAFNIVESFQEQPPEGAVRTPMEEGPAKVRPNPNPPPGTVRLQMRLTAEETTVLDQFYELALARGALPFSEYHPRTGALRAWRFVARPSYQHVAGPQWMASIQLEVLPI